MSRQNVRVSSNLRKHAEMLPVTSELSRDWGDCEKCDKQGVDKRGVTTFRSFTPQR
jgi:hypothetical protein